MGGPLKCVFLITSCSEVHVARIRQSLSGLVNCNRTFYRAGFSVLEREREGDRGTERQRNRNRARQRDRDM